MSSSSLELFKQVSGGLNSVSESYLRAQGIYSSLHGAALRGEAGITSTRARLFGFAEWRLKTNEKVGGIGAEWRF